MLTTESLSLHRINSAYVASVVYICNNREINGLEIWKKSY